jgi:hypothetical protein
MNHHQRKVLHAIFAHPLNANLEMKDIVNVLNGLGAEIDTKSKSRLEPQSAEGGGDADSQVPRILWDYGRGLSGLANTLTRLVTLATKERDGSATLEISSSRGRLLH